MAKNELTLRDWGTTEFVRMHEGHQIQQITVNPGASVPLRVNDYQCEHWVVIHGIGRMTLDSQSFLVDEGGAVFLPARAGHMIENIGEVPLRIVAVQYGPKWGENGIPRPRQTGHKGPMLH